MNIFKKTALGLAIALGVSGVAQASAVAISYIKIQGAMFTTATGVDGAHVIMDASNFGFSSASNTSGSSATLNGIGATTEDGNVLSNNKSIDDILGGAGGMDTYASKGYGGATNNAFTVPAPSGNYAVSDTFLAGSLMNFKDLDGNSLSGTTGAFGQSYDAVSLNTSGNGRADASLGTSTTTFFSFTAGSSVAGYFDFMGSSYLSIFQSGGGNADAKGTFHVELKDAAGGPGSTLFNYTYGAGDNFNGTQDVVGVNTYSGGGEYFTASGGNRTFDETFSGSLAFNLVGGKTYNFLLTQDTLANATNIPEPTSVALLGMGLLGFAASRKKAKG